MSSQGQRSRSNFSVKHKPTKFHQSLSVPGSFSIFTQSDRHTHTWAWMWSPCFFVGLRLRNQG